ncbi:MAG: hypothetical protein ABIO79_02450 [Ferruginibacter sp.]
MKKIVPFLLFILFTTRLSAQNFTGQWKGEFVDKSSAFVGWGGDRCEYILELECIGNKVTGYSYTYFSDGGKRYYTICKLSGTLNKGSKYIEVKEMERTKTNVPVNIRNCFQIHRLSYSEQGNDQTLEGTWVPVPNQEGDCGYGSTVLSRRILQKNPSYYNNNTTKTKPDVKARPQTSSPPPVVKNTIPKKTTPPVVKTQPKKTTTPPVAKPQTKKPAQVPVVKTAPPNNKANPETLPQDIKTDIPPKNLPPPITTKTETSDKKITEPRFEKRNSDLIKTIEIDNPSFTVDLYDNGEIDGDSISLFFNGKLVVSHKRLSDKALRLKLDIDADKDLNELIMYAENLGTIPPNTALMVVNDGDNRYEVRISSDLQKSGVIRFIHKPKIRQ